MPKNAPPVHTTGGRFSFSKLNCHIWFTVDRMEDKLQRVRIVCQRVRIGLFADGQRIAVLRHIVPAGRLIERCNSACVSGYSVSPIVTALQ